MRAALNTGKNNLAAGPLADPGLPLGEQEAMAHLFAGAIGVYRNSTWHRHVPTQTDEATEVIMFASQLLRIVHRVRQPDLGPHSQLRCFGDFDFSEALSPFAGIFEHFQGF